MVLATLMTTVGAFSQGTVQLNNRIIWLADARIILPDGSGAGANFTAQLWGGPQGQTLAPLFPTTDFRTSSKAAMGYVNPVTVTVPDVGVGQTATLELRVFIGPEWEPFDGVSQSRPFDVVLGGGLIPPAVPVGLSGFTYYDFRPTVPEPSTYLLVFLGFVAFMLRFRK